MAKSDSGGLFRAEPGALPIPATDASIPRLAPVGFLRRYTTMEHICVLELFLEDGRLNRCVDLIVFFSRRVSC